MNKIKNSSAGLTTPFGLVILLTLIAFILGFVSKIGESTATATLSQLFDFWFNGMFGLLAFTLQMMMILSLGYALSVYGPLNRMLIFLAEFPKTLPSGVLMVAGLSMISGLFNWGFGLMIGAVFSKLVHDSLVHKNRKSNAGLLTATGYLGMAVWHGGLSGSAPLSVADPSHFLLEKIGVLAVDSTLFSLFNGWITSGLVVVFLVFAYLMAKTNSSFDRTLSGVSLKPVDAGDQDKLGSLAGSLILITLAVVTFGLNGPVLQRFSLNWVIFLFFGLVLIFYRSSDRVILSVSRGLQSSVDIFVQFPFYAGILGLLSSTGLIRDFSLFLQEYAAPTTFPLISFFAAAFTNLLVPSGGGQWAIQGEVFMTAAQSWNLDLGKMVMVFSYGDQITNLLQPFWALPLLSITGVPIRKIFPYTIIYFVGGFSFLILGIWLWF